MRQIKFRAWGNNTQQMLEWNEICRSKELLFSIFNNEYFPVNPPKYLWNVMQFTGLLDKTGKEVYEGDIIRFTQHLFNVSSNKWPKKTKVVKWLDWEGKWNLRETNAGESNFEVIGNIYETPNLMLL